MSLSTRHVRLGMAGSTVAISAFSVAPQFEFRNESQESAINTGFVQKAGLESNNFASLSAWALAGSSVQSTSSSPAAALAEFAGVQVRRHFAFNTTAADFAISALRSCLEGYLRLSDGWDGPESKAPSASAIEIIETVLDRLPNSLAIPAAMLSRDGEVGLYWDSPSAFADIVLEGDRVFSFFIRDKSSGLEAFTEDLPADEVSSEKLDQLFSSVALRKG